MLQKPADKIINISDRDYDLIEKWILILKSPAGSSSALKSYKWILCMCNPSVEIVRCFVIACNDTQTFKN